MTLQQNLHILAGQRMMAYCADSLHRPLFDSKEGTSVHWTKGERRKTRLQGPWDIRESTVDFVHNTSIWIKTELTGHMVAHLNVSVAADPSGPTPSEIDLFLTIRHLSVAGKEINYTGTFGGANSVTKGWLRVSLRKTNPEHPLHRPYLPRREYRSIDQLPVVPERSLWSGCGTMADKCSIWRKESDWCLKLVRETRLGWKSAFIPTRLIGMCISVLSSYGSC